jgi:hypothetical protein
MIFLLNPFDSTTLIGIMLGTGGLPLIYDKIEDYLIKYENIGIVKKDIEGKIAQQQTGILIKPKMSEQQIRELQMNPDQISSHQPYLY